ncbi:hypothetical protein F5878DRAFT_668078 [Lentinula raphanica]|uniref:Uncharacterized protein n=1 Tax=Lentinula raphanica TaxID=153919 RepID=A0AA38U3K6_9AGAR|nr:hypothetical protein F5878DRAFT_668078 [Lentinula raphanica]
MYAFILTLFPALIFDSRDDDLSPSSLVFRTPEKRRRNNSIATPTRASTQPDSPPSTVTLHGRTYVAIDSPLHSSMLPSYDVSRPRHRAYTVSSTGPRPADSHAQPPPSVSALLHGTSSFGDSYFDDLNIDLPTNYKDVPGLRTPPPKNLVTPTSSPSKSSVYTSSPPASIVSSSPFSSDHGPSSPVKRGGTHLSLSSSNSPSTPGRALRQAAIELALSEQTPSAPSASFRAPTYPIPVNRVAPLSPVDHPRIGPGAPLTHIHSPNPPTHGSSYPSQMPLHTANAYSCSS